MIRSKLDVTSLLELRMSYFDVTLIAVTFYRNVSDKALCERTK